MERQIAIYLRLSVEDADKRTGKMKDVSNSIASQRLLINRYLDQDAMLCQVPRIEFCDDGFSGTNFHRPSFTHMMELVRKREISCVIVKDLSRFGRDYLEVGDYLEHIFPFLGVRFISINDDYDSSKHKGETIGMNFAFKNLIYDYYSKDLSRKVKSAMGMRQREATYVSCVPYGYKIQSEAKHQLVMDAETAPIVYRIFQEVIAGKSCTAIARELNAEGVPTPSEYKNIIRKNAVTRPQWTHHTIYNIIGNLKYTGTMVNHTRESRHIRDKSQRRVPKEEWYVRENAHEAIVSQEEYEAANSAIQRRRKTARKSHDCSDRVYFCGHCGGKLEKANGTVFACPFHRYHKSSPCQDVRWKKSKLEEIIFEALKKQIQIAQINVDSYKAETKHRSDDAIIQLTLLQSQYEFINREKVTRYEEYHEGKLTVEEYLEVKQQLMVKQSVLKEQIDDYKAKLEEIRKRQEISEEKQTLIAQISGISDKVLKSHLYDAIEKVLVFDEETIQIIWKFDDLPDNLDKSMGVSA